MKRAAIEMANSSFQHSSHTSGHSHKHTRGQKAPIVGLFVPLGYFSFAGRRKPIRLYCVCALIKYVSVCDD